MPKTFNLYGDGAEGEQELEEGDVLAFPRGSRGLHQVANRTDEPVRLVMLSTMITPEVVEYPDSRKVGTRSATGERLFLGRLGEASDYWEGED